MLGTIATGCTDSVTEYPSVETIVHWAKDVNAENSETAKMIMQAVLAASTLIPKMFKQQSN